MIALPRLDSELLSAALHRSPDLVLPQPAHLLYPERAVQFGTGAFLRGFVEYFLDVANHHGSFSGRVVVVGSTESGRDRAFAEQDGLYTLVSRGIENGTDTESCRIMGVVSRALSAATQWEDVLEVARSPELEFIFSNTTEVGIALDEEDSGTLHPPRSFPGKLTRFLVERARAFDYDAAWSVVVLPCELIEDNGDRLREIVIRLAQRWDVEPAFFSWFGHAVQFCNTLVDRIVPGPPNAETRAQLEARLGYEDALLTICEPYRLFAIEAPAAARDRLRFGDADPGIIIESDIAPYRERKVRLLNGAHTLMVPVALGFGAATVREAVLHPAVGEFVRTAMLDEIAPYVDAPGAALFAREILERFANPHVHHLLADITLQATTKMRVRVVPSILRYAEATGRIPAALTFGFAAHLWYAGGARAGAPTTGRPDDQGAPLRALWAASPVDDDANGVALLTRDACGDTRLWERDLASIPGFCDVVAEHLERIRGDGMVAALDALASATH